MNKINLNKINAKVISTECSAYHIENVIADLVERVKMAEDLANQVLKLSPKSGEIGEGFANNLIEKANRLKITLGE